MMKYITCYLFFLEFLIFGLSYGNLAEDFVQCKPEQVHISMGSSVAEMVVMWSTIGQCSTKVKYGLLPSNLNLSSPGESLVYEDNWNKDGVKTLHMVELKNLLPRTQYHYQPMSNEVGAGPFYFTTSPADQEHSVRLMAFSNLNTTSSTMARLLKEAQGGDYNALLHAGNIAMKLSDNGGQNADLYMKLMEMAIKSVPYMTSPGPMEVDGDTFSQYVHRFAMPTGNWPMKPSKMWYSVDMGLVHLVSFSTEVFFSNDQKYVQSLHDWLITNLKVANENRARVPWIIAFAHHPLYCTSQDPQLTCNKDDSALRKELDDVFFHYGVSLVLASHGGNYERTHPVFRGLGLGKNYTEPLGPVYVSIGAASQLEGNYNFTSKPDEWSAFRLDSGAVPSYGRVHIQNASILTYEQVSLQTDDVLDTFTIVQTSQGKFDVDKLPANIRSTINKQIIDAGGSPDDLDVDETSSPKPESTKSTITKFIEEIKTGNHNKKIAIGGGVAGGVLLLIVTILVVRRLCRSTRRRSARRWENMDVNYGKRYYSKASDKDDMDHDFEIEIPETTEPSRKLLTDD